MSTLLESRERFLYFKHGEMNYPNITLGDGITSGWLWI